MFEYNLSVTQLYLDKRATTGMGTNNLIAKEKVTCWNSVILLRDIVIIYNITNLCDG